MSNNSFYRTLVESFDRAPMRHAATRAYTALFEAGLSPQKKTRRAIRAIIQAPPNGWDAPALDTEGEEILSADHQNRMTNAQCLEFTIRNNFFHDGGRSNPKFEPGVARIAYAELGMWPENLGDWRSNKPAPDREKLRKLGMLVRAISGAHSDEYDFDLNSMGFDELESRFATSSVSEKAVNEEADGSGCRYNVTWIKNFTEATEWAKYTEDTQTWCLTEYRNYWNTYTKGNTVKMYFCTVPGFEDVKPVPGKNAPLDEYGLSLLGVGINPDGTLNCCCTRWNHLHGGTDLALDEAQLCKVLNVRELSEVCPPFTDADRAAQMTKIQDIEESVKASMRQENVPLQVLYKMEHISIVRVALKSNPSKYYTVAINKDGSLAFRYPLYPDFTGYGNYCVVAAYDPYIAEDSNSYNDNDDSSYPTVILRHDGQDWIFEGDDGETEYSDVTNTEDHTPGINHGRVLVASATFESDTLLDITKMETVDEYNEVKPLGGNMFAYGSTLYRVAENSLEVVLDACGDADDYTSYGYRLGGVHPDENGGDEDVYSIYDMITGEELLRRENVSDANTLFQRSIELEYQDDTVEIIGIDGRILRERGETPSRMRSLYVFNLCRPPFRRLCTTLLPDNKILYAEYDLGSGNFGPGYGVKLPIDVSNLYGLTAFATRDGMAALCRTDRDSPSFLVSADGTRYDRGYTYRSSHKYGNPFLLYRKDSDGIPVNLLSHLDGKPVFPPEMEPVIQSHLRVVYLAGNNIADTIFYLDGSQTGTPVYYRVDAKTAEVHRMNAEEIKTFLDFHTWKQTAWNRELVLPKDMLD